MEPCEMQLKTILGDEKEKHFPTIFYPLWVKGGPTKMNSPTLSDGAYVKPRGLPKGFQL